ncbi:GNAT family N-acetyltransferase [Arsenicicoccus sp. oral taxon 190]|uniref:GNAT family N-acetyltransferase n=1 Tax=Arsenicicoccus sp. oral taxon 190 TaxID=1658671 RepID=UPI00067A090D|nr:N-acetyltransferase [Arsenicicoccus sp. oral taxon 190]AKT50442.1 hypothetical protein ADJ73_02310 [Arsenicicoccus sp. oral taxon 190]
MSRAPTDPRAAEQRPAGLGLRPEDHRDHAAVRDIVERAFVDEPSVADLVGVLRADSAVAEGYSVVAELGGAVVGHVMLSRGWVDAPDRLVKVLVLSPLSVAPEWQGQGIGAALVRHALGLAAEAGWPAVFLEGSPLYYSKFGFRRAGRLGFTAPSPRVPAAAFQVVTLPGHESWMTGALVYPDVFWRLDSVGLRGDALTEVLAALGE